VTICPCCGSKSSQSGRGILAEACASCGAHSVGEPLPRPEHELPSYGRSLLLTVIGSLSVLVFAIDTVLSLFAHKPLAFGFWSWIAAAETAAWHLKWAMIPVSALVFFGSRRIFKSVKHSPQNFCGLRYARNGYFASAAVPLLVLVLIGITVPERLRQRQRAIHAGTYAQLYRIDRALRDYRRQFGTLPSDPRDLARLPDSDGSLALALANTDITGYSVDPLEVAAVPTKKPRSLRGAAILNASVTTNDEPIAGISFTNYHLRLPGDDKILGTDDDLILSDGLISKVSDLPKRDAANTVVKSR